MIESVEREVRTFRGRSLEEVLPQIRAELGPDAIVLRRREGLTGGIGGFFQRPYVEVEASGPDGGASMQAAAEAALGTRNDRATAEGLASPAIQLLLDQASPFADQLQAAQLREQPAPERSADILGSSTLGDAGLYGPQPYARTPPSAPAPLDEDLDPEAREPEPEPDLDDDPGSEPGRGPEIFDSAPGSPARPPIDLPEDPGSASTGLLAPRPAAAATAERRLALSGLDSALAADIVGEAVVHGLPFATPRSLKKLVRTALALRIPVLAARGGRARSLAFVGGSGAGKTTAVGNVAVAYAEGGTLPVLAVALRSDDGGAGLRARLGPAGVAVHVAADGAEARRIIDVARGAMVIVDTSAVSLRDADGIRRLAADLELLELDEVHLALPATVSGAAAAELARALHGVGLTHVALTRTDETEHPGAPIGFCISSGGPLSYLCEHDAVVPADPAALALRLLP